MLKVDGLGVINVRYRSDISFCERPLKKPVAPKALIINVATRKIALIHAFLLLFI
jgi:hypothetical protein